MLVAWGKFADAVGFAGVVEGAIRLLGEVVGDGGGIRWWFGSHFFVPFLFNFSQAIFASGHIVYIPQIHSGNGFCVS